MATHSNTLAWEIPWVEEPGRLQSVGSQRVAHNLACIHISIFQYPEQAPRRQKENPENSSPCCSSSAGSLVHLPSSLWLLMPKRYVVSNMQYLSFNPTQVCLLEAQQSHLWTPGCDETKYNIYCQPPSKENGQQVSKDTNLTVAFKEGFLKARRGRGLYAISSCASSWLVGGEVTG